MKEVKNLCTSILKKDKKNFDALQLLGLTAARNKLWEIAADFFFKALEVNPNNSNLHNNQGIVFQELGQVDKALHSYRKSIYLNPENAEAFYNQADLLKYLKSYENAIKSYMQAITVKPDFAEAFCNLGILYYELKEFNESELKLKKAINLNPNYLEANINLGNVLLDLKRFDDSLESYNKAIAINQTHAESYCNRGNVLIELNRLSDALFSYDTAISLKSNYYEAYCNRGNVLKLMKRFDEALESYDKSIEANPSYADAYWNKSLTYLYQGDFVNGLSLYDWRWKIDKIETVYRSSFKPEWDGKSRIDRILVWSEQGVGDEIMFAGLLSELQSLVGGVIVEVDERLIPIFARSLSGIEFVSKLLPVEDERFDAHLPMGSLMKFLRPTLEAFNAKGGSPYLLADIKRSQALRSKWVKGAEKLIGISWKSKNAQNGHQRSLSLKDMVQALQVPGVKLVNLQYGDVKDEILQVKQEIGIEVIEESSVDNFVDLDGLAALIMACDEVISVDNSTVHLSGALGKEVQVLLPFSADWRWMEERADSPWYRSVKLHRQGPNWDWQKVLALLEISS